MRSFKCDNVDGFVRTERHLEFGDFRRVEEAVKNLPKGHYIVSLDDELGLALARKDESKRDKR